MDIKEFAQMLDNRQSSYPPFTKEELRIAQNNGFVIVYGASNDLMELEGAIYDEADYYDGGVVRINKNGVSLSKHDKYIEALWYKNVDGTKSDIAWQYNTNIPHETFMIYEDDEKYCRGIVFRLEDVD